MLLPVTHQVDELSRPQRKLLQRNQVTLLLKMSLWANAKSKWCLPWFLVHSHCVQQILWSCLVRVTAGVQLLVIGDPTCWIAYNELLLGLNKYWGRSKVIGMQNVWVFVHTCEMSELKQTSWVLDVSPSNKMPYELLVTAVANWEVMNGSVKDSPPPSNWECKVHITPLGSQHVAFYVWWFKSWIAFPAEVALWGKKPLR